MKVYTQNPSQETLTVQQRFGLGCISGAVAHAVFYPLEVSESRGRSDKPQDFSPNLCLSFVFSGSLPPLLCPAGVEGEAEPAAGRHVPRRGGVRPLHLHTRGSVVILQRFQTQHPLHGSLRGRGVRRPSGEQHETPKSFKNQYLVCKKMFLSLLCSPL